LAQELKRRRMKKGMSQAALAALIGSSQPRVAKMEQGDPSCSVDLLMKALLALGVHRRTLGRLLAA
jgi:transcriptional regulator with XRE-family HTH domain